MKLIRKNQEKWILPSTVNVPSGVAALWGKLGHFWVCDSVSNGGEMAWLWPGWIPQSLHNPCQGHPVAPPATPLLLPLPVELGIGCLAMKNFSEDQPHWEPYWKSLLETLLETLWGPYCCQWSLLIFSLWNHPWIACRMLWSNDYYVKLLSLPFAPDDVIGGTKLGAYV